MECGAVTPLVLVVLVHDAIKKAVIKKNKQCFKIYRAKVLWLKKAA